MDISLLEHVLTVSRRMAQTRSLQPLLYDVMDEAIKLVGAERGYIVLLRSDGDLDYRVQRDHEGRDLHDAGEEISHSILDRVITEGQPVILRNAVTNTEFGKAASVIALQLRSVMCVPLISRGKTLGAIYVENRARKGRFKEEDLPPLILFSNQAAIAIENATLNDDLEAQVTARTHELKEAMIQLKQSWLSAIETNRVRTTLLTRISQDLRNPLTVIINTLSLMRDGGLGSVTPDQITFLQESLNAATAIMSLGNDLFELSSIQFGDITLNLERVSLEQILERVFQAGHELSWPSEVNFQIDLPPGLPMIPLDTVRIHQVVLDLILYAHERTTSGSVTLYARLNGKIVKVGVVDTGPMLNVEQRHRLFERFHFTRADVHRLGASASLPICKELIEMHGGSVSAETAGGGGLDIAFTLPF